MIKKITNKHFLEFIDILEKNNFKKEEFLFNSKPYLNGFKTIINKTFEITKKQNTNILDLGCGTGLTSFLLSKLVKKVTAIDIYDKSQEIQNSFIIKGKKTQEKLWNRLEKSNNNLKLEFYDGKNFPFKKNSFDMIFCHAVIEHIPTKLLPKVLDEIYRTLKKNGYFVISRTPNKYALTEFLSKSHDIKFSKKEIFNILNQNNYKIIHYQKTDFFPENASPKLQKIINKIHPITNTIDKILNISPLEMVSHHHFIIAQKTDHINI